MEKYLSICDLNFKLCDEDSRISTNMETKPPYFAKKRAAESAKSAKSASDKITREICEPLKICEICEICELFKTCEKTRRKSASEKHKMETTSDETGSSEVVL